ncbi:MAG: hypothetical protein ACLUSP_10200 [Christensenellales bacterium]
MLKCFAAGKNVVSANKELIAKHWGELEAAAKENGVGFISRRPAWAAFGNPYAYRKFAG